MDQRLGVYIINLDRAPDRWAFMEGQMRSAGLDGERIQAIDRRDPGFTPRGALAVQRDDVLRETNWDGRFYVLGEEACFQSHLKALNTFITSGRPAGLIMEDDCELAPDFRETLDAILGYRALWDLVKLEGTRKKGGRPALKVVKAGSYELVASMNPSSGAAAYLVTQPAAARLVAAAGDAYEPFDNFLSAHWRHGLKVLDCSPFPARQGLPESTRSETRGPTTRTGMEKFTAWRRHIGADTIGRYAMRWVSQPQRFAGKTKGWTIAKWARDDWAS
jgi:glycosyl transferase family 25